MLIQTFQYSGAMTEDEYSQYCNAVCEGVDLFTHVSGGEEMTTFEEAKFPFQLCDGEVPHKYMWLTPTTTVRELFSMLLTVAT